MICGTIAQGRTIETPSSLCTTTPLGFWWPIKCNNEHREDSPDTDPIAKCDKLAITSILGTVDRYPSSTIGVHLLGPLFHVQRPTHSATRRPQAVSRFQACKRQYVDQLPRGGKRDQPPGLREARLALISWLLVVGECTH